jgi:hypothetical protein
MSGNPDSSKRRLTVVKTRSIVPLVCVTSAAIVALVIAILVNEVIAAKPLDNLSVFKSEKEILSVFERSLKDQEWLQGGVFLETGYFVDSNRSNYSVEFINNGFTLKSLDPEYDSYAYSVENEEGCRIYNVVIENTVMVVVSDSIVYGSTKETQCVLYDIYDISDIKNVIKKQSFKVSGFNQELWFSGLNLYVIVKDTRGGLTLSDLEDSENVYPWYQIGDDMVYLSAKDISYVSSRQSDVVYTVLVRVDMNDFSVVNVSSLLLNGTKYYGNGSHLSVICADNEVTEKPYSVVGIVPDDVDLKTVYSTYNFKIKDGEFVLDLER